ncbi:MAG: putative inorganic carbon ((-)) transporter [Thermoleophilaceae bacterium]|nr:putative inorganic carbon ((-)) transporter [Thermoleophilaceae bacterium]
MAELIWRLRAAPRAYGSDLWWVLLVGGLAALILGWAMTLSIQAACAFTLVLVIVALYQHDERWGLTGLLTLWLLAPFVRRILALMSGPIENDPLSLAPFLATAALAALALVRVHVPTRIRVILLLAAGGFAMGIPIGFASGPRAAIYSSIAYLAAVSAGVLGYSEGLSGRESTLRRVLMVGLPLIAAYAIAQRYLPLTKWDQTWLDVTDFNSIGTGKDDKVRVFGTLNSPGTLGALLALSLLCYLSIAHRRVLAIVGAVVLTVGLSLTFVRSAWWALVIAGFAHVVASRGQSARLVFGTFAVTVLASLALSPVSSAARDVVNRFETITKLGGDRSATDRQTSFSALLPESVSAPMGHGLGSAGESTKLSGDTELRFADNGYLSLMYQVGPLGFLLVVAALGAVLFAAWDGARARAPGQEWRLALFAMVVYLLVLLPSGDAFYGSSGVILWFIAGQVLAFQFRPKPPLP